PPPRFARRAGYRGTTPARGSQPADLLASQPFPAPIRCPPTIPAARRYRDNICDPVAATLLPPAALPDIPPSSPPAGTESRRRTRPPASRSCESAYPAPAEKLHTSYPAPDRSGLHADHHFPSARSESACPPAAASRLSAAAHDQTPQSPARAN